MIHAGKLRHRVTLQTCTTTADSYGQPVETWTTLAEVWAAIMPLRGREFFAAQQEHTDLDHRIIIRHKPGFTAVNRVLWGSRIFDVQPPIVPEERRFEMHFMGKERLGSS
jgi:SPP1 family predicted phage head-tail adaptor